MATCENCGAYFQRADDEDWKALCLPCWKRSKRPRPLADYFTLWQRATAEADRLAVALEAIKREMATPSPMVAEFRKQLPRLIQLCHPDRHGGSEASTKATAWLLSVKRGLEGRL